MNDLEKQVCEMIVSRLGLDDLNPDEIHSDSPLFKAYDESAIDNSLGLDSVDALELVVGLREEFDVTVTDEDMHVFESIGMMARFIEEQKMSKAG